MGTHLVEPGTVLADRYVVEDLLGEEGEAHSWRARDKVLARSVVLQVTPSSNPAAADLIDAAKRASHVSDPRVVQVLDAVKDEELSYVVREWATGQPLQEALAESPLPARRAAWVVREVARALHTAHRVGLPHLQLTPRTVILTRSSGVKVIGLGTLAALHESSATAADPARTDTRDLGRLLYACLTARWPDSTCDGLPAAPTEHGRLLRPRQVRAGVPRRLDTLCDRILSDPPRTGEPITTVEEVSDELNQILAEDAATTTSTNTGGFAPPATYSTPAPAEPPPALLRSGDGDGSGNNPPAYAAPPRPPAEPSTHLGRTMLWAVVIVLVVAGVLLAYLIGKRGLDGAPTPSAHSSQVSPSSSSAGPSSTPHQQTGPIKIAAVHDFDPPADGGNGHEHSAEAKLAVDGNPATAWSTLHYYDNPQLGGLKSGVGLVVDLGKAKAVHKVTIRLDGSPTSLQVRAAPADATAMPDNSAHQYRMVQTFTDAGTTVTVTPKKPIQTRYLLVWLTKLPQDGPGKYLGRVAEIQVFG